MSRLLLLDLPPSVAGHVAVAVRIYRQDAAQQGIDLERLARGSCRAERSAANDYSAERADRSPCSLPRRDGRWDVGTIYLDLVDDAGLA